MTHAADWCVKKLLNTWQRQSGIWRGSGEAIVKQDVVDCRRCFSIAADRETVLVKQLTARKAENAMNGWPVVLVDVYWVRFTQ